MTQEKTDTLLNIIRYREAGGGMLKCYGEIDIEHGSPWIKPRNQEWEAVLSLAHKRTYKKGAIIDGSESKNFLYYLHRGRVKYSRIDAEGPEKIFWYIDRGNLFGEVPFWSGKTMENSFTVTENAEIFAFSRACVQHEIMSKHPSLIINMLTSMANKLRVQSLQNGDFTSLISRLSRILMYAIGRDHKEINEGRLECKGVSQQELASLLGVHRVTLNNAVAQLKREGIIGEMTKKKLVISDCAGLMKHAAKVQ